MLKTKLLTLFTLCALPMISACSTNPATGRTQFAALMSPQQESQVGAQEHPEIIKEYGLYDNQQVVNYVNRIGAKIAKDTERPDVTYKFTVLDSPVVNAFALPGGYVYTTRGLVALAGSEAELAAVLAHEVGHITGRHSAERYSRGVVTSLGANVLAAAIDSSGATQALGLGSQLYLSSYSRSQEDEADTLGIRYLSRAGYDPSAMSSFLQNLQNSSALEAQIDGRSGEGFSYFSTHPATSDRVAKTRGEVAGYPQQGIINHAEHLAMIDGMTYGDSEKQGFVRGNTFYHPALGFKFNVPADFNVVNKPSEVVAVSKSGAIIVFDLVSSGNKDAYSYLTQSWMKSEPLSAPERINVNGINAATAGFQGRVNGQVMTIQLVAIEYGAGKVARFQIGIPQNISQAQLDALKSASYSFGNMSASEKASIKPMRIDVFTAGAGDTVASIAAQMPFDTFKEERFRVLNGLSRSDTLKAGVQYKTIR